MGKEDTCIDVARKKRGRPKNLATANEYNNRGGPLGGEQAEIKSEPVSGGNYYPGIVQEAIKRQRADGSVFQTGTRYVSGGAGGVFAAYPQHHSQYQASQMPSRHSPASSPSSSSSSSSPTTTFAAARSATPPSSYGFGVDRMESERSGGGSGGGGGGPAMLESVLSLLVEEVKELRHATQQLREEHMLLANEVVALQRRQTERDLSERDRAAHPGSNNMSPSSDTSSPFSALNPGFSSTSSAYSSSVRGRGNQSVFNRASDSDISPPSSNSTFGAPQPSAAYMPSPSAAAYQSTANGSGMAAGQGVVTRPTASNAQSMFASTMPTPRSTVYTRKEITNYLPFLAKYPISSPDAPFAIDDINRPFAAVRRVTGVPGEWEYSPPIFVFANDAFCAMVKYPLVMFPDEQIKRKMSPFITQKTGYPLSDLIFHSSLCVTKDGKLFRFPGKYQICYSEHGQARWGIICGTGEDIEPVTFETNIPAAASAASFFARERDDPTVLENLQWGAVDWASNATSQIGGFLAPPIDDDQSVLNSRGSKINHSLAAGPTGSARITELESTDAAGEQTTSDTRGNTGTDIELLTFPSPLPSPLGRASGDFSWLLRDNPPGN